MDRDRRQRLLARLEETHDGPLLGLSLAFLAIWLAPLLFDVPQDWDVPLEVATCSIWAVFAVDLSSRTYFAEDRRQYLLRNWPDLLVVLLPFLRVLRLLALIAVAIHLWSRWRDFFKQSGLHIILGATAGIVLLCASLVFYFERSTEGSIQSLGEGLWWAVVTVTTVGYGDLYPRTTAGRIVAAALMLVGAGLLPYSRRESRRSSSNQKSEISSSWRSFSGSTASSPSWMVRAPPPRRATLPTARNLLLPQSERCAPLRVLCTRALSG